MKSFVFDIPYEISFSNRKEWFDYEPIDTEHEEHWYTDGSLTRSGTGCGFYGSKYDDKLSIPMDVYNTVFQDEIHAIQRCAQYNLNRDASNKEILICSDSKAALMALKSNTVTSKEVNKTKRKLRELCANNSVII